MTEFKRSPSPEAHEIHSYFDSRDFWNRVNNNESPITEPEIRSFAKNLLDSLVFLYTSQPDTTESQDLFIFTSLLDNSLKKDPESFNMGPLLVAQLRAAVKEKMRELLATDKRYTHLHPSQIFVLNHALGFNPRLDTSPILATDLYNRETTVQLRSKTQNLQFAEENNQALRQLLDLPETSPHLILPRQIALNQASDDIIHTTVLKEKLNLVTLAEAVEKQLFSPEELLHFFRDGIKGASFLEKNGLTLQDISLQDIVIYEDPKDPRRLQGALLDLEGLVRDGFALKSIIHKVGYVPPEFDRAVSRAERFVNSPSQMVYQFGVSLKKILKSNLFLFEKQRFIKKTPLSRNRLARLDQLEQLVDDMCRPPESTQKRIDLDTTLDRLEKIIDGWGDY